MAEITTDLEVLRKKSEKIEPKEASAIAAALFDSIPEKALGLAAPQINIHKRMFVAGQSVFINPVIESSVEKKIPSTESCLSLPDTIRCIDRHPQVTVSYDDTNDLVNPEFTRKTIILRGQDAFVAQHEIDHLNGVLITDHPEVKSFEQRKEERDKDRERRKQTSRLKKKVKVSTSKTPPKKKKLTKKAMRTARKREKISVEIQEKYRAFKEGLIKKDLTDSHP